jgi:protein-tyrosine phosphatase
VPFVDLHCHLLPGVDDGPQTMEESVAYARDAVAAGTGTIVATPHVEVVEVAELPERVDEVRAALAAAGVPLDVQVGGELKPGSIDELDDDDLEIIAHGPPGARWLLYEVPFDGVGTAFLQGAKELRARGFGLLLAHPERSRGILKGGLEALEEELRAGSVVAANVGPLIGQEGAGRQAAAREVLRRGMAGLLATDAHAPTRPWTLAQGRDALAAETGDAALAAHMTADRAAALLRDGIPLSSAGRGRRGAASP